jgi:hypothetical protein
VSGLNPNTPDPRVLDEYRQRLARTAGGRDALAEYRKRLAFRRKHATNERRGPGLVKVEQARFALADALGVDWLTIAEADALADGGESL